MTLPNNDSQFLNILRHNFFLRKFFLLAMVKFFFIIHIFIKGNHKNKRNICKDDYM